jgi:hypothetical protein
MVQELDMAYDTNAPMDNSAKGPEKPGMDESAKNPDKGDKGSK